MISLVFFQKLTGFSKKAISSQVKWIINDFSGFFQKMWIIKDFSWFFQKIVVKGGSV